MWTPQFMSVEFAARVKVPTYLTTGLGVAQVVGNPLGFGHGLLGQVEGDRRLPARHDRLHSRGASRARAEAGLRVRPLVGFFTTSCVGSISAGVAEVVRSPAGWAPPQVSSRCSASPGALAAPWLFGFLLDTVEGSGGYLLGYLLLAGIAAVGSLRLFFLKLPRR